MLQKPIAAKNASLNGNECSRESNTRQFIAGSAVWDSGGICLHQCPQNPPNLSGPIDGGVCTLAEIAQVVPHPLVGEDVSTKASNAHGHSSSPTPTWPLPCQVENLLTESLLDDVPSWQRSLLSHCMFVP